MADVNFFLAFGAGVLSFISPCCLPLYPAFLSYITGMSVGEIKSQNVMLHKRSFLHTLFFLIGFSLVFLAIGFGTSMLGNFFTQYKDLIRQVGAIIIIFFGLVIIGVFSPSFLMRDKRFEFKNRPGGLIGSALIGLAFAAGWTPCTGPILGSVIYMSTSNPGSALIYMIAYILGFAIPFFILSFFIGKMKFIKKYSSSIVRAGGYLMIVMGIVLFFDWMTKVYMVFTMIFGGFKGF
ncbi:cytochrome c biogenesis CcdA family protein [Peribacillus sp. B-H-3]|uniref:cytochrome c biogenesis CcdA family protein n=1 Tax=Peribacillus sp. B-H-3 TaxID=3400420 RepID=UPI003B011589